MIHTGRAFLAAGIGLIFFLAAGSALCVGPIAKETRRGDVVSFRGSEVTNLLEVASDRIGGFALKGGRLEAVPFQIDERDKNGDLIYTNYKGGTTAKRDGKLGEKDEILFLAQDAGERRKAEPLPPGAAGGAEIKVTDPLGGPDRWLYLLRFGERAPRSDVDYVRYDPKKDWVEARYYTVGFPYEEAIQIPSHFAISEAAGGSGKNIYDLFKIRLNIDLKIFGTLRRSQNDFANTRVGYVAGPVRVSRRVKSALRLAGPIKSATFYNDSAYYPYYCAFPALLQIPFKLEVIAHSASMRVTDDLSPIAKGSMWYNERNPEGIEITGKPSPEAEKLDRGPFLWKLGTGPQGTIMTVTLFDPGLDKLKKALYYCDDETTPDEPCQFVGQIANSGYELTNLESVAKGDYKYTVYVFCPVNYKKGDEQMYLNSVLHPLSVTASPMPSGES